MLRFRRLHTAHLSVIACLALSSVAYAEPAATKPTAAQLKDAKRDLNDAAKLMKKKEYAEALPKLQAAYAIDPQPATLGQIGTCQRELSQYAESHATFTQLLATEKLSAKDKAFAEKNLDELAKLTGTLRITVSEAGAEVSLDGKPVAADALGNPIRLQAGSHEIAVRKAGFEPVDSQVQVDAGGEAHFEGKLIAEVKTAHVRIAEKSGGEVRVLIDGKDVGAAPWEGELQPGKHTIELKGITVASQKQTIEVAAKQQVSLQLDASIRQGQVKLSAIPGDAVLLVNGEQVTLPFEGALDVGTHKVEVSAPGYGKVEREIVVTAEQPTHESFALEALPSAEEPSSGRFVKPGLLVGIGLPRLVNGEVVVKLGDYFAIGGQYAFIPSVTFPGKDAKLGASSIQGTLRTFPFGGAFYVGVNGGLQMLEASMSENDLAVRTKLTSPVIAPQIGWLWTWDSGFALGINAGVQIPFAKEPETEVEYNGVSVASAAAALPEEKRDKANSMTSTVTDLAKLVGKTPFPQVDLIKIGFFF